jgi:hypothetical protein
LNRTLRGLAAAGSFAAVSLLAVGAIPATRARANEKPAGPTSARPFPTADRKALERVLRKAFEALPPPGKEFRLDTANGSKEIAFSTGAWAVATKAPAEAKEVRVYEKHAGSGEDAETCTLEVRVYLNMERGLPDPLGSEGGELATFTHDGAPAARASLAGVGASRVALPLTAEEGAGALTVLRLHVGAEAVEGYLAEIARGRIPPRTPWDQTAAKSPSEVRTIVVEFYGPRAEVERLLTSTPVAPLRALLSP